MTGWAVCAAVAVAAAVAAAWRPSAVCRLRRRSCGGGGNAGAGTPTGEGMGEFLAQVRGRLRGGGTVQEALGSHGRYPFATRSITVARMAAVLRRTRNRDETMRQVESMAFEFTAVCRLSERSGCEMVRCLDVVADDYRRLRMMEDLRRNAFAMPLATVRLLSALPFLTVAMGMLLGADPVGFLLGSAGGMACLGLGGVCYLIGLVWLRALFEDEGDS